MSERKDHTQGWESCMVYETQHRYRSPQGAIMVTTLRTWAPSQRAAMVASTVAFMDIVKKLR